MSIDCSIAEVDLVVVVVVEEKFEKANLFDVVVVVVVDNH